MGIDTATFKSLKDIDNEKVEITPDQYQKLVEFFRPKKIVLNIGNEPDSYYDRFMFYLFKHGETVDNFVSKSGIAKSSLKKIFTKNGVSGEYKDQFTTVIIEEEFNNLNSYVTIELSNDRSEKIIKSINTATLINAIMVKRGYDIKSFANKMGYSIDQTMNVLGGFISSSIIEKASKALNISETAINHVTLNSWDLENNFGYFLQKTILERKENIYSMAEKINMNYCDLKAIVSGARNIRDDEFDKIALGLNLDPVELRKYAPTIIEGDDKYVAYNFLKWFNESGATYQDCNDIYKGAESIIYNIRHDNIPSNLDIIKLMQITGLTKEKLRAPLTDDEIAEIKSFRKTPGRRAKTKDTFNSYIREILKQNNLSMHEFADLLGLHPDALKYMMRKARLREDIKNNFLEILNLDNSILKKFKVSTYKFNPNAQNKSKKNNPKTTIEETNNMDNDSKETKYNISYDARVAAISIFIDIPY